MEREERKTEYLEHFADAFAENGIDKTSIKKLASAAGINEASIYQYFKNKDEIIVELVKRYLDTLRDEVFSFLIDENYTLENRMQRLLNYRCQTESREKFVIQVLTNPTYGKICYPELKKFLNDVNDLGVQLSQQMHLSERGGQCLVLLINSTLVADRVFNCRDILAEELEFLGHHINSISHIEKETVAMNKDEIYY